MKKVFAVILSALMLLSCASAMAEGTFRVGMECNYAPYNWTQAEPSEFTVPIEGGGGYADGYDVQIAKLIAEGLGKELVIVKTEWDGLPMGVMSGAFDAIIAGMSPTEERKATLDFQRSLPHQQAGGGCQEGQPLRLCHQPGGAERRDHHRPAQHLPLYRD